MKHTFTLLSAFLFAPLAAIKAADTFLVENGQPRAEIVISENPTRMQRVAAHEFRQQIEKISGARLPIVTQSTGNAVKVFIGASETCPVKADGLKDGAYRITSGADWVAFIGTDTDFEPVLPFARGNGDIPRAQAEWEQILGAPYGMPMPGLYKNRLKLPGDTGKPEAWQILARVARDSGCPYAIDPKHPVASVVAVGSHLLTLGLNKWTSHQDIVDLRGLDPAAISVELHRWIDLLLGEIESGLGLEPSGQGAADRIRRIRMSMSQFRRSGTSPPGIAAEDFRVLGERALLVARLFDYSFSYLEEKPTLDRFVETVSRIQEDFYSQEFIPLGPRKAILRLGEPISVEEALQAQGGRLRDVASQVTATMASRIQEGLDAINQSVSEMGAELVPTRQIGV